MKRMPYPKFELDGFIYVIENTLPFLLLIAFLAMNINVVRAVVTEKEKRIKVNANKITLCYFSIWLVHKHLFTDYIKLYRYRFKSDGNLL